MTLVWVVPRSPSSPINFNRPLGKWGSAGGERRGAGPVPCWGHCRGTGWPQESRNTLNSHMEALIQEEKFLSSLCCNPVLERRIRGGLSSSEPRSLYSRVTDFMQRFSTIWKIPVDLTQPCGLPRLSPVCVDVALALGASDTQLWGGWALNFLISKGVGFGVVMGQVAFLLATADIATALLCARWEEVGWSWIIKISSTFF